MKPRFIALVFALAAGLFSGPVQAAPFPFSFWQAATSAPAVKAVTAANQQTYGFLGGGTTFPITISGGAAGDTLVCVVYAQINTSTGLSITDNINGSGVWQLAGATLTTGAQNLSFYYLPNGHTAGVTQVNVTITSLDNIGAIVQRISGLSSSPFTTGEMSTVSASGTLIVPPVTNSTPSSMFVGCCFTAGGVPTFSSGYTQFNSSCVDSVAEASVVNQTVSSSTALGITFTPPSNNFGVAMVVVLH